MKQLSQLSRRARWAVPTGAVVVVGGVLAGSMISVAQAAPSLPAKTPAQLLASLASKPATPPLTGTVVETSSLGLPSLPGNSSPGSLASLLTGSHTIRLWYSDPRHFRVAVPQSMSESDIIRNGGNAWVWESSQNTVTHVVIPARADHDAAKKAQKKARQSEPPLTPQQAANEVLRQVGPTTTVRVDSNVTVAGEAAYQLVLAPKSSTTRALGQHPSSGSGLSGDSGPVINALVKSATPVSGSWGSGRLIKTSLISVLITDNGRVLVGAVTPQVLYSAAAQVAK
jgi:hypothetical protein